MKKTIYILISGMLWMTSCANKPASADDQSAASGDSIPAAANIIDPAMGHLSAEDVTQLLSKADKVDMIFYNHPISVTQEDEPSVRNTVMYILPTPPSVTVKCPPLGRLAWMSEGVIIREADVFQGNGCNYLLFMENNQPVAANALANEGVQFFTSIISQVNQKQQQIQQSQQTQ
jgi:hypothetical protein